MLGSLVSVMSDQSVLWCMASCLMDLSVNVFYLEKEIPFWVGKKCMRFLLRWLVGLNIFIGAVKCRFCILTSSHRSFFLERISLRKFLISDLLNCILRAATLFLTAATGTIRYIAPDLFLLKRWKYFTESWHL